MKIVGFWLILLLSVLAIPVGAQTQKKNYTVDDLMPNARLYVRGIKDVGEFKPALELQPGQAVVFVGDYTVDPLVVEAVTRAIREVPGVLLTTVMFPGFQEKDPVELLESVLMTNWWPKWIWDAFDKADVIVQASRVYIHWVPGEWRAAISRGDAGKTVTSQQGKKIARLTRMPYVTPDLLGNADLITFPPELYQAINAKVWERLKGAKELHLTDPSGTDVRVSFDDAYWQNVLKDPQPWQPGHITIRPSAFNNKANGVIATNRINTGEIPHVRLMVKDGRVANIEGGGKWGAKVKEVGNDPKFKNVQYPGFRAPGVDWFEEISLGTNPKWVPAQDSDSLTGITKWQARGMVRGRSGFIHMAVGTAFSGADFIINNKLPLNHRDMFFFHITYLVDGNPLVENGHLTVLDDPEIRQMAAKYGDPDKLLKESWIPVE